MAIWAAVIVSPLLTVTGSDESGTVELAYEIEQWDTAGESLVLESPAGLVEAVVRDDGLIAVNMGAPELEPERIPFVADERSTRYELEACGRTQHVSVVSMGNPHCVLLVDSIAAADIDRFRRFFHGMLEEGVYLAPSAFEAGFVSIAHSDDDLDETIAAAAKVFAAL